MAPSRSRPWLPALAVTAFFLTEGFLRTLYLHFEGWTVGSTRIFRDILLSETTGSLATTLAFFVVVLPFARRWPVHGEGWPARLPAHALGLGTYSVLKTMVMWGIRIPAFPLFGLGEYNYGRLLYRFPMEAAGDVLGYALTSAAVHWWYASKRAQEREVRTARLETQLTSARLSSLSGQLQPHFLFNTLNTIGSLVHESPEAADRMITRLSDLLRHALEAPSKVIVTLREEVALVDEYAQIMLARFGDRAEVRWQVEDNVADALIPRFVIQPLVENAFKYGIEPRPTPGTVTVTAYGKEDHLIVLVQDDGPGVGDPNKVTGTGLGLANLRARLSLLYGDEAQVEVKDRPEGGAIASITIPLVFEGDP